MLLMAGEDEAPEYKCRLCGALQCKNCGEMDASGYCIHCATSISREHAIAEPHPHAWETHFAPPTAYFQTPSGFGFEDAPRTKPKTFFLDYDSVCPRGGRGDRDRDIARGLGDVTPF